MKLTKKKEKYFAEKIEMIKELEQQKKQTEEALKDIKDEIKSFMDKNKTTELEVGVFTVHYAETKTERFDSKALKAMDEELYSKFLKTSTAKRFSIT
ncbi:MAG: hypothetical protein HDT22_00600 [Ruminococcus sp.]|nr:hypothetical protein [Ruminococcus sp.]